MSDEPREKRSGETMSDYIVQVANELPVDAVGMWQIVPGGRRGFDLEGDALTDYVRRCIAELLSRGAVPVFGGGPDGPHEWIVQRQYGSRPEEIIENVIREAELEEMEKKWREENQRILAQYPADAHYPEPDAATAEPAIDQQMLPLEAPAAPDDDPRPAADRPLP